MRETKKLLLAMLAMVLLLFPVGCGVFDGGSTGGNSGGGTVPGSVKVQTFDSNYEFSAGIKSDGTLYTWGNGSYGRLGHGDEESQLSPKQVGDDDGWATVAIGWYHTLAIKTDGSLWAWGENDYGQLGNGTSGDEEAEEHSPIRIGTDNDWALVTSRGEFSVAIKTNGALYTWGLNDYNQLGDGTLEDNDTPTQVGEATNWVSASAGGYHVIAINEDGELWAWGFNGHGALGDGSEIDRDAPVRIGEDNDWAYVSATDYDDGGSFAIKTNGTLWGWGENGHAQLGVGDEDNRDVPTQVGDDDDWVAVSGGYYHTIALKGDGSLWGWGYAGDHQLGEDYSSTQDSPVMLGDGTDWAFVAAGYENSHAIKTDGSRWGWGVNYYGELGNGSSGGEIASLSQIGEDTDWWATGDPNTLVLTTTSFEDGQAIPDAYTGEALGGVRTSPQLSWANVPEGTVEFVVICDDPDSEVNIGYTWVHWNLYSIPATTTLLEETENGEFAAPIEEGFNSFGNNLDTGYDGPFPPIGQTHTYYFTVYALDAHFPVPPGPRTRAQFEAASADHILGSSTITGTYTR